MISKPIDAITKSDIDSLVTNSVPESKTIEYKRDLPGGSEGDKKEFLADISSFANASGGDIIYGIKEKIDNGNKTGLPESIAPLDASVEETLQRIESLILTGIEPKLRFSLKSISGWNEDGKGFVLLIHIPKSYMSPHMVTYAKSNRFFSRYTAGKQPLDVGQIRAAFLATESQSDRIRMFVQKRLGDIISDETPVQLKSSDRLVLHIIPLESIGQGAKLDFNDYEEMKRLFPPLKSLGSNHRYNLDGFLTYISGYASTEKHPMYTQIFRDGTIELVYSGFLISKKLDDEKLASSFIMHGSYEREILQVINKYFGSYKQLGIDTPIVIMMTLLGCRGARMYTNEMHIDTLKSLLQYHAINRDMVPTPDIVVNDYKEELSHIMKPAFDAVWNACGFPSSQNYDASGKFKFQ